MTVLFGIDVGTSATKGLAITPDGDVLATEEVSYPLSAPKPGWSEQDPEDWWRATEEVLAALEKNAGEPAGIGLSGQMHGLVALDEHDDVSGPRSSGTTSARRRSATRSRTRSASKS